MADYVYLDSNAFWLMKPDHPRFDSDFKATVARIGHRYRFPFSEAHFRDIAAGDKPGNEPFIEKDLAFLETVSNGRAVVLEQVEKRPSDELSPVGSPIPGSEGPWITHYVVDNVAKLYRNSPKAKSAGRFVSNAEGSHPVAMDIIPDDNPMKKHLLENDGIMSSTVFDSFIQEFRERFNEPKYYKNFRKYVTIAASRIGMKDNIMGQSVAEKLESFQVFVTANSVKEISNSVLEAARVIAWLKGESFDNLTWPEKLLRSYSLLDYNQYVSDSISNKNRPSNMMIDANHIIYAACAKHFVTMDGGFHKKAGIIFSALNVSTRVSDLSSFKSIFS